MKKSLLVILSLLILSGCAGVSPTNLTAEQLKALNSDKNITVICNSISTFTTDVLSMYAVIDKSIISNGDITIGSDCSVKLTNSQK